MLSWPAHSHLIAGTRLRWTLLLLGIVLVGTLSTLLLLLPDGGPDAGPLPRGTALMLFVLVPVPFVLVSWAGALMLLAAVGVFFYALNAGGGFGEIARSISSSERFGRQFLEPFGETPVLMPLGFFLVFGIGVLGQPHMLHKFFMLRDPRRLGWLPLVRDRVSS